MNSKESWALKIDHDVYKNLAKIPSGQAEKILNVIENLPSDLYFGDIKKIKGEKNLWRKRVGAYRIFYEIHFDKKFIHVIWLECRTSNTY